VTYDNNDEFVVKIKRWAFGTSLPKTRKQRGKTKKVRVLETLSNKGIVNFKEIWRIVLERFFRMSEYELWWE
jgi:hypothetical protein